MRKKQTEQLEHMPVGKLILRYYWPAFVGVIANSLYNIIDRIFIGQGVGAAALSGITAVFPVMIIIMAFGMLIGMGGSVKLSIFLGEKKYDKAEKVLGNVVLLIFIVSFFVAGLGFIIKQPMLELFGATQTTMSYANDYLNIILFGIIFQMMGFSLNSLIRSEGNARLAMISMLLAAGINIPLDWLFIIKFGWGVKGAAWATIISMSVLSLWVLIHFRSKRSVVPLKWHRIKYDHFIVKSMVAIGLAPFFMQVANSFVQGIYNSQLIKYGGDLAVGAFGIIMSVVILIIMSIIALNMASQPIIGYNYGARNISRVRQTLRFGMIAATVLSVISWALLELFPEPIVRLFNNESKQLQEYGIQGLRIFVIMLPLVGFQIVISNYFQSVGKAKVAAFLSLLRQVIVLSPLLFIFPNIWGLKGIWMASPTADTIAAIIAGTMMIREWKKNLAPRKDSVLKSKNTKAQAATQ
ncbi:MATE family efflux transporter [Salinivirga cyanobacteriivorans]|nr:MATE family efflux transporter [Salinivirga cyanobacteriivorans]